MMCKNDTFVAKEVNTRLTKICVAIFALAERLQTSANLLSTKFFCSAEYDLWNFENECCCWFHFCGISNGPTQSCSVRKYEMCKLGFAEVNISTVHQNMQTYFCFPINMHITMISAGSSSACTRSSRGWCSSRRRAACSRASAAAAAAACRSSRPPAAPAWGRNRAPACAKNRLPACVRSRAQVFRCSRRPRWPSKSTR